MEHNDSLDDNLDILGAVFNNRSKNAAVKSYNRGGAGGWRGGRVAQPPVAAAGRQPLISQYCTKNDGTRAQRANRYSPYFAQKPRVDKNDNYLPASSSRAGQRATPNKSERSVFSKPMRVCQLCIDAHSDPSGHFDILPQVHLPAVLCKQVKEWRKYRDNLEIVFDVFAALDSTVCYTKNNRLEFVIRDRTDALKISYYEMDTNMPRAPIGTYFCVTCLWRYWGLQAVKVTLAAPDFAATLDGKLRLANDALQNKLRNKFAK